MNVRTAISALTPLLPGNGPPAIRLLGSPALLCITGAFPLPRHDAALLAVLALDGPTSRHVMADLLWPDAGDRARNNLRQRLARWRLRQGLLLQQDARDLLAMPDDVDHDLRDVQRRIADDPSAGAGQLLGDLAYDHNPRLALWVAQARARWRAGRTALLVQAADRLEREGRFDQALAYATELVVSDPLLETGHRSAMRLHYLRGDRSAALAAFSACSAVLERELDVRPGPETAAMARLIERSDALPWTPAAPLPSAVETPGAASGPDATEGAAEATALPETPLALLRPPVIVGRAAEWQALDDACGARRIVVVCGEAGMGKSRLLGDFAAAHGPALVVRPQAGSARVPYDVLARLVHAGAAAHGRGLPPWVMAEFARWVPEFGAAPTGRVEPVRLRRALVAALVAWHAAGLRTLFVDDLQLCDLASLELLLASATELVDAATSDIRLLLAARPGEMPPALAGWIDACAGRTASPLRQLTLGPLDAADVAELVDSVELGCVDAFGGAAALARYTGGNPWFVVQTLAATLAQREVAHRRGSPTGAASDDPLWTMSGPVMKLVERRLLGLSAAALRIVRVAALADADIDPALVAEVLAVHVVELSDAWKELEKLGVVRDFAFVHDIWADVARRGVPPAVAAAVHRGLAAALQARAAAPARIAAHFDAAGDWAPAARHYRDAASLAFTASRRREQLELLDRATACFERIGDQAGAFASRLQAADAALAVLPGAEVERRLQEALDAACNDRQRLEALLARCKQLLSDSIAQRAVAPARAAFELAGRLGDVPGRVAAAGWLGLALTMVGDVAEGLRLLDEHAAAAERLDSAQVRLDYAGAAGYALFNGGRFLPALAAMRNALALAEQLGDHNEAMVQANNLAIGLASRGRSGEAASAFDHALRLWQRLGEPTGVSASALHMHAGSASAAAGRYDEALARLLWAAEHFAGRESVWRQLTEHRLAGVYLLLGQPARARGVLTALPDDTPAGTRLERVKLRFRIDRLARSADGTQLEAMLAALPAAVVAVDRLCGRLLLSSVLSGDAAVAICADAVEEAARLEVPPLLRHARIRHADALRRAGMHAAAAEAAAVAMADVGDAGGAGFHDLYPAEFWWLAHQALAAGGYAAGALRALERGAAFIAHAKGHVPADFVESFLHRNAVNVALLAAVRREACGAG